MILLAYLVYSALISAAGAASLGIAAIIISGPLLFGFYRILVNMVKGKPEVDMGEIFCGFTENFVQSLLLSLMTGIFTFLWSLLFVFPGIVKSYSYSMAMFIMQDDPSKDWEECLDESKEMMKGHKWQLFCLDLSFIGWALLGFLCCCVGILFVYPYQFTARANFYMALKASLEPDFDDEFTANEGTTEQI
jgi:uncharacterized membrane protein